MSPSLRDTVALITGASSGIGHATALALAAQGASVALVARRKDRLEALTEQIEAEGGTALRIVADITERTRAEAAVQTVIDTFGRLDILVNNAGLMLIDPVLDADPAQWEQMIAINQQALLYMTHAALPHLVAAAAQAPRRVADVVNISSHAGRVAFPHYAVYNMTKFGVNGFTEALRQEVTRKHVRVGALAPGAVATELISHNRGPMREDLEAFSQHTEVLRADDVAEGVVYMVTRPRHASIADLWLMPTDQG